MKFKNWMLNGLLMAFSLEAFAVQKGRAYKVLPKPGSVEFLATGKPGFLKIKGTKPSLKGQAVLESGKLGGDFEVDLNEFETGIELRDEHMKKTYLETAKFPTAKLKIFDFPLDLKGETGSLDAKFKGELTLHGVSKPVTGDSTVSWTAQGKNVHVKASFSVELSAFAIAIPAYLGVKVADTVLMSTDFEASEQ